MNNHQPTTLKQLMPLFLIIGGIIILIIAKSVITGTQNLHDIATDFMGFFFLVFGCLKLIHWHAFAYSYAQYDLIAKYSKTYALIYPFIELGLGFAYIMHIALPITNVITIIIMTISSLGVLHALLNHGTIICACLGTLFSVPLTWVTLIEDLLMALMGLLMFLKII